MLPCVKLSTFIILLCFVGCGWTSLGDRSVVFVRCLEKCTDQSCSDSGFQNNQSWYMDLLAWDCQEECKYQCMWSAVDVFIQAGKSIPQFYGKWPFVRVLGIQEPASVFFSFLNGLSNCIAFVKFYSADVPKYAPMKGIVVANLVIALNAWIWSIVYHSRDFLWTERLDYFCATSLVVYNLYIAVYRWSYEFSKQFNKIFRFFTANIIIAFYLGHISYLSYYKFDYGYNMKANVTCGVINSFTWLTLCYYKRKECPHVWKMVSAVISTNLFLCFEIFDFPPLWWIFDAHSIWHLLTVPVPFLYYSFLRDDALVLHKRPKIP